MKQSSVILLVENDKDLIYRLEQSFRKENIQNPVRIARHGNEAILYLRGVGVYGDRRAHPLPALILLDLNNPDGSSMAVLGWIRQQPAFSGTPVLVLAESFTDPDLQHALDRGANAFCIRTEALEDLTRTIRFIELMSDNCPGANSSKTPAELTLMT